MESMPTYYEEAQKQQDMSDGPYHKKLLALTKKYVDVEELTQTIVNESISRIVVYARTNPVLSGSKDQDYLQLCRQCGIGRCQ